MAETRIPIGKINTNFLPTGAAFVPVEPTPYNGLIPSGYFGNCVNISSGFPFFLKSDAENENLFDALAVAVHYKVVGNDAVEMPTKILLKTSEEDAKTLANFSARCKKGEFNIVKASPYTLKIGDNLYELFVCLIINGKRFFISCGDVNTTRDDLRITGFGAIIGGVTHAWESSEEFQHLLSGNRAEAAETADTTPYAEFANEANTAKHADIADCADVVSTKYVYAGDTTISKKGLYAVNFAVEVTEGVFSRGSAMISIDDLESFTETSCVELSGNTCVCTYHPELRCIFVDMNANEGVGVRVDPTNIRLIAEYND